MINIAKKTREVTDVFLDSIPYGELVSSGEPVILKGVASDWPLVVAGLKSNEDAMQYMKGFDAGRQVTMYKVPAEAKGRIFYNEDLTGFNYEHVRTTIAEFMDTILAHIPDSCPPSHYVGSRDADGFFPGLRAENDLPLAHPMFDHGNLLVSVWMGS
ncbi:MAG: cupin-like domain-containing protein, partial [Kordiimonas sp.]